MSSYRRYYLPRVSWSDVKGGVWRIQPYNVTDYFFIFRVQNLLTSALLRISPHTFAFISIPPMSLSSRKRSILNISHHILPCVAPLCEGMHYHKTGVPWQMKSTFIIVLFLPVLRGALGLW